MIEPEVRVLNVSQRTDLNDIGVVRFEGTELAVTLESTSESLHLTFNRPVGFRYLDEGDLLEFWPHCSLDKGWLFEVLSGGWFDLESRRPGFLAQHNEDINEYLVVTQNGCLSVLARVPPVVSQFPEG